jgi:ankyrin repeat protein
MYISLQSSLSCSILVAAGEDPNRCNDRPARGSYSPLQAAVLTDNEALARLLLAKSAKVDHRSAQGDTPLELTNMRNRLGKTNLLLGEGAKVNSGNDRNVRYPLLKFAVLPGFE